MSNRQQRQHHIARQFETPTETFDDLCYGKSCTWTGKRWLCVDCGGTTTRRQTKLNNTSTTEEEEKNNDNDNGVVCKPLKRRKRCRWYKRRFPDDPPRASSHFHPRAHDNLPSSSFLTDVHAYPGLTYERADCTLDYPSCFNLSRCDNHNDNSNNNNNNHSAPLSVFVYTFGGTGGEASELIDHAAAKYPELVQRVMNPDDACLLMVSHNALTKFEDLSSASSWRGGQNHFLWHSNLFPDDRGDNPLSAEHNFEFAALASLALTDAHIRLGYDFVLHLPQRWGRPMSYSHLDLHRPRRLLLSFKGGMMGRTMLRQYYSHRWLAAEYWERSDDVAVDVVCRNAFHRDIPYETDAYEEWLLNSTFVFCPGGSGVSSYRFTEALSADAIPVVLSNLLPPLYPEVDWSQCIVRISEARIVDLPRILREMPTSEVQSRQRHCRRLLLTVLGQQTLENPAVITTDSYNVPFRQILEIWLHRIHQAKSRRDFRQRLDAGR